MAQFTDGPMGSYIAGEAIAQFLRVKIDATTGLAMIAGLTDRDIGTCETPAFASGDRINVRYRNANGTCKFVAAGAVAKSALIYTAAAGKVDDVATATGYLVGTSMEAAAANGDVFEGLRNAHGDTVNP